MSYLLLFYRLTATPNLYVMAFQTAEDCCGLMPLAPRQLSKCAAEKYLCYQLRLVMAPHAGALLANQMPAFSGAV